MKAVPADSTSIKVPEHLKESWMELRNEACEDLWGWARQIHAWLKAREPTSHLVITKA